jgi:hypothetical protein
LLEWNIRHLPGVVLLRGHVEPRIHVELKLPWLA